MKKYRKMVPCMIFLGICAQLFTGCGQTSNHASIVNDITNEVTQNSANSSNSGIASTTIPEEDAAAASTVAVSSTNGTRDNTIVCLSPSVGGTVVYSNSVASIDASNASEGYVSVEYTGTCPKVKLQITKLDSTTYTYNLYAGNGYDTFPFSDGSGTYSVIVYENRFDNQYAVALSQNIDVTITNTFGPNLYPNQYVSFDEHTEAVQTAASLVQNCNDDLSAVTSIYNYVSSHISYDYDKAENVQSGYLCDIDSTLKSGTGICLDYASVMCAMLRSQRIPTRLEVGYAGTAYHAWISVYIKEIGWVNGIIQFDGESWQIMDPTFASTSDPQQVKSFIGDGTNYQTKYIY